MEVPMHIVRCVGEFGFVLDFGFNISKIVVLKPNGPGNSVIQEWEGSDGKIIVPEGALDCPGRYVISIPKHPELVILDVF